MRRSMLTGAVLALSLLVSETAMGQFGPYGHYGGWGAGPYAATARSADVSRQMASQRHATTFARGQQQVQNLQRDIRGTLSSQAQGRAASMERHVGDYKDWWFRTEQQQFAQRQAQQRYRPAVPRGAPAVTPSTMQQAPARKSTDIIPWPAVLRDARFAQQRARVEGPFRKQAAEGTPPTVDEYKGMIDAGEKMKQILKGAAYQISAGDYMAVEKFLDAMAAESQERIDRRTAKEPAVESSKKPAAPAKGE